MIGFDDSVTINLWRDFRLAESSMFFAPVALRNVVLLKRIFQ